MLAIITNQLWLAALSSSAISAVLCALITGAYVLRNNRNEYVNDYFKTVIQRRLAAYEYLENLIVSIKTAVIDSDNKPYHLLFSKDDDWTSAYTLLHNVMSQGLWLSDEAFEKSQELNYLAFRLSPSNTSIIDFGKKNYEAIATIRSEMEKILANDMLELHDVKTFLKRKKKNNHGFHTVQLHK